MPRSLFGFGFRLGSGSRVSRGLLRWTLSLLVALSLKDGTVPVGFGPKGGFAVAPLGLLAFSLHS